MTALIYFEFIFLAVLFVVTATALLRWADRRFPRFRSFLDRHFGEEPEWLRPY